MMIDKSEFDKLLKLKGLKDVKTSLYLYEDTGRKSKPVTIYLLNIENRIAGFIRTLGLNYLNEIQSILDAKNLDEIPDYNPDLIRIDSRKILGPDNNAALPQNLFRIDSAEIKVFSRIMEYLTNENRCDSYKTANVKEEKLKSWIIKFEFLRNRKIEQLLFFQKFQPSKMLSQNFITIFEENKKFKMLKGNLLNINHTMDFFYYMNTFVVTKMTSFERTFNFHEYYQKAAIDLINELTKKNISAKDFNIVFADTDDASSKINSHIRLAHKLFSAQRNHYYKDIDYNMLIGLNSKRNFGFRLDDSRKEWTIDKDSDLNLVARVLNDDFEKSLITNIEYLVDAKQQVQISGRSAATIRKLIAQEQSGQAPAVL